MGCFNTVFHSATIHRSEAACPAGPGAPERPTPAAVDAERVVLGALLLDSDTILSVTEILPPGSGRWFYREAHHLIYDAILTLVERREPVDLTTVTDVLYRRGHLEKVGGSGYLAELLETVTTTVNAPFHARLIREKSLLRSLVNVGSSLSAQAYEQDDIQVIVAQAQQSLLQVASSQSVSSFVEMSQLMTQAIHHAEHANEYMLNGIRSGFYDLDEKTNGWHPANLIVIAARPAMGKSSLALQLAVNGAEFSGQPVVFFSLEMSTEELGMRLICSEARIDSAEIRSGATITPQRYGLLMNAGERLRNVPLLIDDSARLSVLDIRARVQRLQAQRPVAMIVLDYLQLLRSPRRHESRTQEVSEISRDLKELAKELHVPVIALSQLNRDVEKRGDHAPQLSDLRDGGSIEQDADLVIFIYRDEVYNKDSSQKGIADLIIAKQRNGPIGTVKLAFNPTFTRFDNLAHTHHEQATS